MARIHGQIESLKNIKNTLKAAGINRFSSIGELSSFLNNFDKEQEDILNKTREEILEETRLLKIQIDEYNLLLGKIESGELKSLQEKISQHQEEIERLQLNQVYGSFKKLMVWLKKRILYSRLKKSQKRFDHLFESSQKSLRTEISTAQHKIDYFKTNIDEAISKRSSNSLGELTRTFEVVNDLKTVIAGAVGENRVEKEISKLPDNFTLINDFSVEFTPPLYNRKENDRVYSVQIDHILVSNAGIFVIETKNWSRESVQNLSLRSPVEQVRRTGFALFTILNSDSQETVLLDDHHWGQKTINVRNLIVMINNKPKESFKNVKVVTLKELLGYIQYFDPVFSDKEVARISNYLINTGC